MHSQEPEKPYNYGLGRIVDIVTNSPMGQPCVWLKDDDAENWSDEYRDFIWACIRMDNHNRDI
jgi:hypothetical protein